VGAWRAETVAAFLDPGKGTIMSDVTPEVVEVAPEAAKAEVDWKEHARTWEARAKENAAAAAELAELRNAGKSEADKVAERVLAAEAAVAAVPSRVAESLRDSLVALGVVSEADKVLLTASDPETLLAQVKRLSERAEVKKVEGNRAPLQGRTSDKSGSDPVRDFARDLFRPHN
jgi:hypothetical protein